MNGRFKFLEFVFNLFVIIILVMNMFKFNFIKIIIDIGKII